MKMRDNHFTLVELIAAMAILALVGSAGAAALAGFQKSHSTVVELSERMDRNRKLDKFADIMGNMIPFFWRDETEDNAENLVFDGREDELFFTAMRLPDDNGRGAFIFVRLYINENNQLACDYKDTPLLPWLEMDEQQSNLKTEILAENISTISFTYGEYNEDDEIDWLEIWDREDEDYKNSMPAAVGFTLEFESGEKLSYLRRTAGISAYSGLAL